MANTGDTTYDVSSWTLRPLREELKRLGDHVKRLEDCLLSKPGSNGCVHTFPLWMVIPPQGCWIKCPVCGVRRFIPGNQISW